MSIDGLIQSQLIMAQSFGALNDVLLSSKTMQASTRDVVATLEVPSAVTGITVDGVTTAGDGQAGLYTRVAADPGAVEKVQSADGSWFQLAIPTTVAGAAISGSTAVISGAVSVGTALTVGTTITAGSTIMAGASVSAVTFINAGTEYRVAGTQVVGPQIAGWGTPAGVNTRGGFSTATITLPDLAQRVARLILDLKTHGLIA